MMEQIQKARGLYKEYLLYKPCLKKVQKQEIKNNIHQLITAAIGESPPLLLFENPWMLEILKSALKQINNEVLTVERAFKSLEKYFIHLIVQPWKEEFKEIKMYGGFFRTRVKSVIPDCEHIFERAGYMVIPAKSIMVYRGPMDKDFLILLALDCRVSQMECKVIAEQYNRAKDLSQTLHDVISWVLGDRYLLDKITLKHSLTLKHGMNENILGNLNASAPPAIPKRIPIIDGSFLKQNVKFEKKIYNPSDDRFRHVGKVKEKPGVSFPKNPPHWSSHMRSLYLHTPQMSSGMRSKSSAYIDNSTGEHIPELPQGTTDDHLIETLRLVNRRDLSRQHVSEDFKRVNKNITGLNQTHALTTPPLVARGTNSGIAVPNSFQPVSYPDEGIEIDMPMSKYFSIISNSKYGSVGAQNALPTKHAFNISQASIDPGYDTRNQGSIYSQFPPSLMYNMPQAIYHPPSTQSVLPGKATLSRQNAVPCQIPPLTSLKPSNLAKESVNSNMYSASTLPYSMSQHASVESGVQSRTNFVQPSKSVPGYLPCSGLTEQILNKQRPAVCKTSSLKTDTNTPLSKEMITTRTTRNVDMSTFWECPSCSKLNTYPDTICSACSQIYIDADVRWMQLNETQACYNHE